MANLPENSIQVTQVQQGSTEPARSLNHQIVLNEEEYTEALSRIIARDFFPSLVHLEASNDYLDALRSEDPALINASIRRLSHLQATSTPYSNSCPTPFGPHGLHTPLPERESIKRKYDEILSLDEFQAKYTSEDNSSFTEILNEENKQRRGRWKWAWDAQKSVEDSKKRQLETRERLLIEPSAAPGVRERLAIEIPEVTGLIADSEHNGEGGGSKEKEKDMSVVSDEGGLAVIPRVVGKYGESEEGIKDPLARKKDNRPVAVDGWEFKARNNLMFPPDADESPHATKELRTVKRTMKHSNTRLNSQEERISTESEPPTPTRSFVNAAINGTPYRARSPEIAGYSLVPHLPSPTPDQMGPSGMKRLMTVGQIMSTPRILSIEGPSVVTPDTPFHLPKPTQREVVAHRLSSTASRSLKTSTTMMRDTSRVKRPMDPPSMTPRRLPSDLTPAARRLLDRTVGGSIAINRRGDAMSKISGWERKAAVRQDLSKHTWTPSPKR